MTAGPAPELRRAVAGEHASRFLRACRSEPVDATPVWFMRQAGRSLPEYRAVRERASLVEITRDAALCAEVTLQPVARLGVDAAILFADITTPLAGMGVKCEIVEGVGPVIEHPVRTMADVLALRTFEPSEAVSPLLEAVRLVRAASPVPLIGFAGAPFTLASYLVEGGPSADARQLRRLMRSEPAVADALFDRLATMTLAYLSAQVAAGAQAVQLFDSWVGVLGPSEYRQRIAPHMRRLFDGLCALGVPAVHFGTGTAGILPDMAAAGGDVIGLDWRIGLADGRRRVDGRAVQGNLDPTLLLGPFAETGFEARRILEEASGVPGHVFNLGHGVLPGTDPDDLRRLVDLVHEVTATGSPAPSDAPSLDPRTASEVSRA